MVPRYDLGDKMFFKCLATVTEKKMDLAIFLLADRLKKKTAKVKELEEKVLMMEIMLEMQGIEGVK